MEEIKVTNLKKFHEILQKYNYNITIFRGVTREEYELLPRIGRIKNFNYSEKVNLITKENDFLRIFKERAIPFLDRLPDNKWDWLAIAQHYRLPTRLLDWTRNPLVAAYFAVEKKYNKNSAIYALEYRYYIDIEKNDNPLNFKKFGKFIPPHTNPRIIAQNGIFTIHPDPQLPFKGEKEAKLEKIIIENKNDLRKDIKEMLYHYGIHEASLFPGLDSLAHHIEWMKTKGY